MARLNFQDWMAIESPKVEKALDESLAFVPLPCRAIAAHILKAGGKRLRPLLVVAFARALDYDRDDVYPLATSLEMLHAATLLHDDILDRAGSRRGQPAAHILFGEAKTILTGDALLAAGNSVTASYDSPSLCDCYARATALTAAGEILEMDSLGNPEQTRDTYMEIAMNKTAALIANACVMGATLAGASPAQTAAAERYGENVGLAFQIVDDALDFAPQSQTGKPCGGDLREGKLTPPIRLFRDSLDPGSRDRFDASFRTGNFDPEYFSGLIKEIGRFVPAALAIAKDRVRLALDALSGLPDADEKQILKQIADYVVARCK